jgi:serine/threonine-protein kinase
MMIPCRILDASQLQLLLEDRLTEDQRRPVESHLETCPACRAALEDLAGDSRWWDEARRFVPGELAPEPAVQPTEDHRPNGAKPDREPKPSRAAMAAHGEVWLDFLAPSDDPEALGRLGAYEVRDVLGRGGMGIVLKAFDPALDRMVALKVLSPALAASGAARRRFAREAKAAAAVVHEHVVAIHAVDCWRGLPYLVMQYVSGRSLQERIDHDGPLELEEVLRIGLQSASGLAAAHAHGLVHRDVKPSNILLENGLERVKLTDFGLARAADDASLTQSGVLAGTPQYMAPEQALGESMDHRADLFSLGSVLYAMCAGRPPFRAETTMAVIRRVCDEAPRPLREINPDVPPWLAAIIARLHAKDPAARYQSATEVADLLGSHLAQVRRPDADPALKPTRPRIAIRPWAVAAAALFLLFAGLSAVEAGGLSVISSWVKTVLRIKTSEGILMVQVEDPEVKVRVDGEEVVITGTGPQEFRYRPGRHEVVGTRDGVSVYEKVVTIQRGDKEVVTIGREGTAAPGPTVRYRTGVGGSPTTVPLAPGMAPPAPTPAPPGVGTPVMVPLAPGMAPPAPTPAPLGELPGGGTAGMHYSARLLPGDGSTNKRHDEVMELQDRIKKLEDQLARLQPARPSTSRPGVSAGLIIDYPSQGKTGPPNEIGPAPGARGIAPALEPGRTADRPSGNPSIPVSGAAVTLPSGGHNVDGPEALAPTRSTPALALPPEMRPEHARETAPAPAAGAALPDAGPRDLDAPKRQPYAVEPPGTTVPRPASPIAVAPASAIPAPPADNVQSLVPAAATPPANATPAQHVAPQPVGAGYLAPRAAASAGAPALERMAPLPLSDRSAAFACLPGVISSVAFSPEGREVALACGDGSIVVWVLKHRVVGYAINPHRARVWGVAFSPDGKTLASAAGRWDGADLGAITLWDVPPVSPKVPLPGNDRLQFAVAFSPDGKILASAGWDQAITLWDVATGRIRATCHGHEGPVRSLAFHPDGRTVVSASFDGTIRFWEAASGRTAREPIRLKGAPPNCVVVSRDGTTLAANTTPPFGVLDDDSQKNSSVANPARAIVIWDWASQKEIRTLVGCRDTILGLALSPDGRMLASAGGVPGAEGEGEVKLFDLTTGRIIANLVGHSRWVECVAFSPDGKILASAGGWGDGPGEIKLWDLKTLRHQEPVRQY